MNNYKKVGLTALCGTLASFSVAQAGAIDVSGSVTATYASNSNSAADTAGNPYGMSRAFSVKGSGELDNGMAWSYGVDYDADFAGVSASQVSITADGMGTFKLGFDSGDAVGGIDDVVPTVWEEADGNGITSGMDKTGGMSGGILSFVSESGMLPMGATLKASYTPVEGGGDDTTNKAVGGVGAADTGSSMGLVIAGLSPVDGLTLDVGYNETERDTTNTTYASDWTQWSGAIKYATGPVTIGYQRTFEDLGESGASSTEYYENEGYGVTFQVNDNLSIGFLTFESVKEFGDTTASVTVEADSYQATYNLGGATVKFAHSEVDNQQYISNRKAEHRVLAVGLAF